MSLRVFDLQDLLRRHAERTGHDLRYGHKSAMVHGLHLPTIAQSLVVHNEFPEDVHTRAHSFHPLENKTLIQLHSTSEQNTLSPSVRDPIVLGAKYPHYMPPNEQEGYEGWLDYHGSRPDTPEGRRPATSQNIYDKDDLQKALQEHSAEKDYMFINDKQSGLYRPPTPEEAQDFHKTVGHAKLIDTLFNPYTTSHGDTQRYSDSAKMWSGIRPDIPDSDLHKYLHVREYTSDDDAHFNKYLYNQETEQLFAHPKNK